jgi:hypothetical protein
MRKVDFFIVGAPKCGTTSLYHYLNEHIDIEMSSQKEPDFFSDTSLQKQKLYYAKNRINTIEKYNSLFRREDIILRGDASVSYLFYEDVSSKIIKYNPKAKIIIMLRNPIDRAFSHYLMDYSLGLISLSFEEIIKKQSKHKNAHLFYQQYIEVSEYALQVKRYLDVFKKEQIFFIDYDDFKNNTFDVVNRILIFLNLDYESHNYSTRIHNTYAAPKNMFIRKIYSILVVRKIAAFIFPKVLNQIIRNYLFRSDKKPKLHTSSRDFLKKHFKGDVRDLSYLLNKDFSKWIK